MDEYIALIKDAGLDVIDYLAMGGYQGDLIVIVKKADKFGMIVTGYGSCSGCDVLQACYNNKKKLKQLQKELCDKVIWKDITPFITYLKKKDWRSEYYYGEQELPPFIAHVIENLLLTYLARI